MNARVERVAGRTAPSMRRWVLAIAVTSVLALLPVLAHAEDVEKKDDAVASTVTPTEVSTVPTAATPVVNTPPASASTRQQLEMAAMQNVRPRDIQGVNVFEAPKVINEQFEGRKLNWGFGFAQQFQGLNHRNSAAPKIVSGVNTNQLVGIGYGFNNANANLYLDAQLAKGIRVALTSYLSSRHHQETWVKDGYIQIDSSPIDYAPLHGLMEVLTLKVGHFEINYGDAHFRRSDNGNAFFNPFVGNLLMDAFTTEIGGEVYARKAGFLAMAGVTGGEVKGQVQKPDERSPSFIGKVGYDKAIAPEFRVRLTSSIYRNAKSVSNTLYSGSRAGSRYYSVLENVSSTEAAQAWSGDVQPGFKNDVTAVVINPFVRISNFEFFGNLEQSRGKAATETVHRYWTQYAGEGLFRLLKDQIYVGGRYNLVQGNFAGANMPKVQVERIQTGGGWYVTPNVLAKLEYVRQNYMNYPFTDIKAGGSFDGFMIEGVVSF